MPYAYADASYINYKLKSKQGVLAAISEYPYIISTIYNKVSNVVL
jgi:hypothetical protein